MDSWLVSVFRLLWLVLLRTSVSLFEYLCPFECIARSTMTGSYGKLCLTLWGADKLFHSGAPLTIPTSNAEGLCFSTSWPTLVLSFFLSHFRCEVVSSYTFDLHFPSDWWYRASLCNFSEGKPGSCFWKPFIGLPFYTGNKTQPPPSGHKTLPHLLLPAFPSPARALSSIWPPSRSSSMQSSFLQGSCFTLDPHASCVF